MNKEESGWDSYFQDENPNSEWIEKLFENEKNEPYLKQKLNNKWVEILNSPAPKIDLKHILYKIHFNINSEGKVRQRFKTKNLYNRIAGVAAIFVLPLLALSIYLLTIQYNEPLQFSEIVAPKGEKARFILPDGSSGYLNSGSTLKYACPFNKNRLVELEGEGFFDVTHDKPPFTVKTEKLKIEVHGTRFNVCAYPNDPNAVATLEEGSISAISENDGKRITIAPGEQVVLDKSTGRMANNKVDIDLYVSWKDNLLKFQKASFAEVVKKMERWYDVRIILDDKLKYTQRYTMTIKTESLREMLGLMAVTTPMQYEIKEDIVYITLKKGMPMK